MAHLTDGELCIDSCRGLHRDVLRLARVRTTSRDTGDRPDHECPREAIACGQCGAVLLLLASKPRQSDLPRGDRSRLPSGHLCGALRGRTTSPFRRPDCDPHRVVLGKVAVPRPNRHHRTNSRPGGWRCHRDSRVQRIPSRLHG